MAQTFDDVAELMDSKADRPKRSLPLPNSAKYFFTAIVVALLLLILAMGAKALRDAPPATIQVSSQGLSPVQYQSLQQTMSRQTVSSFFRGTLAAENRLPKVFDQHQAVLQQSAGSSSHTALPGLFALECMGGGLGHEDSALLRIQ